MATLQPISHPSAWKGEELFERAEWSLSLTDAELAELLDIAKQRADAFGSQPTDSGTVTPSELRQIETDSVPELPLLGPKLKEIQDALENGSGVVRLLGFPANEVDETLTRHAFWIICKHIGTPVSQSAAGERIFSVRDAGFANDDRRARGPNTRKKLSFHTDRCDVISFLCYRQAKSGGDNDVVSSMTLFNQLLASQPDVVETLTHPYLYQRHNVDTANELPYVEQPIFSFCEGHFAANLLRVLIERAYAMPDTPDMTTKQREALDILEQTAERADLRATFRQNEGDMLFLNNFVTFHRRTEFVDHNEPERKRHLLRVWLSMPNSRPLDPRFAGNYGATAAGAIRGGMRART